MRVAAAHREVRRIANCRRGREGGTRAGGRFHQRRVRNQGRDCGRRGEDSKHPRPYHVMLRLKVDATARVAERGDVLAFEHLARPLAKRTGDEKLRFVRRNPPAMPSLQAPVRLCAKAAAMPRNVTVTLATFSTVLRTMSKATLRPSRMPFPLKERQHTTVMFRLISMGRGRNYEDSLSALRTVR